MQYGGADEQRGSDAVNAVLAEHGLDQMSYKEVVALQGKLVERGLDIAAVPYSFYREMRTDDGREAPPLGDADQAVLVYPDPLFHRRREEVEPWNDRVQIGGEELGVHRKAGRNRAAEYKDLTCGWSAGLMTDTMEEQEPGTGDRPLV